MTAATRYVQLVDEEIDQIALHAKLVDPDVGAQGWFVGVTRETTVTDGATKTTQTLCYTAHRPMAVAELESIADRAAAQFGLLHVVIVHRLGEVPVTHASVVVGCCSPHRQATFDAFQWIMQTLKRDVPIWKRESYQDGSTEWVHPIEPAGEQ